MKASLLRISGLLGTTLATLVFVPALTRAATVIDHLPYKVSASGEYVLQSNLTADGTDGITVGADNVVINLNGFALNQSQAGDGTGMLVRFGKREIARNVIVRNGIISDFSNGVLIYNAQGIQVQDLNLLHNVRGIALIAGSDNTVANCTILGSGGAEGDETSGILLSAQDGGTVVKGNLVSGFTFGIDSVLQAQNEGSTFLENHVSNSIFGLALGGLDSYEGNTVTNCKTPFQGGRAIGTNCFLYQ
jgi:nitrous oxidase accessory protein NosD